MHPLNQIIKLKKSHSANAGMPSPEQPLPRELGIEELTERAARCGAMLSVTADQALMIRMGMSSWHCTDPATAAQILCTLESRHGARSEGVAA